MRPNFRSILSVAMALGLAFAVVSARSQEMTRDRTLTPMAVPADGRVAQTGDGDPAAIDREAVTGAIMTERDMLQYCVNIADSARETRYAIIQRKLDEKQDQIARKLASLDEKMNAIREYVEIREKFRSAAEKQVVSIYETMRPDAAASQLSELETGLAASIVMKLDPKVSSKILTEMPPKQAAMIANYLTVAMQPTDKTQADR